MRLAILSSGSSRRFCFCQGSGNFGSGHLNDWALSLHSGVATGGGSELMRTVHKLAEQAQYGQPIRWKEVQNQLTKAQRKDVDSEAVNEAMRALASAGYGVIEMGQRGGTSYKATAPLP